ncbi:MAG: hypothetical protein LBV02_06510 [Bacteroidales bacterium]|jgi:hypothetical protein|nr:hypothetical protein [Bacteroidales bacterium]
MKQFFFVVLLCNLLTPVFSKAINGGVYYSEKRNIVFDFDNSDYQRDWSISPEIRPDILRIYCEKPILVTFHFPAMDASFTLSEYDTVNFVIILEGKDSAYTQLIGVKEIPNTIGIEKKLFHLSHLWSEVKYNFVNIDRIPFDWDSLYFAYIPLIQHTINDYEYFRLLQRFYASLQDGHTEVFIPHSLSAYEDYIPISINVFDRQLRITSIQKNKGLDSSFLAAKIIKIDNIPIDQYLQDSVIPYISASTEQSLWMQIPQAVCFGLRSKKFNAEVLKANGEIDFISLQRDGEATRTIKRQDYNLRPIKNESWDFVQLQWFNDSILRLSINAFYPEDYVLKQLNMREEEILNAKRLIIDLRRNGGGSTTVAHALQSHLTEGPFLINYAWQTRINDGVRKANGNWIEEYEDYYLGKAYRTVEGDTIYISDSVKRWTMPKVILFGEFTFSAAEDFLVNLYETKDRPLLIGSESGGSTGSPLVIENLPLDGLARLCTRRILYPYSLTPFVGKGVLPDILVKETYHDYCSGQDETLKKAIEIVSNLKK